MLLSIKDQSLAEVRIISDYSNKIELKRKRKSYHKLKIMIMPETPE